MSDNRDPPVPANAPAPDALFALSRRGYARSDKRGMIECANTLPSPANSLDRTALLGTPQKILHHPNMPRGLIHLIWQTLERDQPVGAYICDHSHTGERFWVFAVFLPIKDGYLSVQLSPSSAGLEQVGTLYRDLLAAERDHGFAPAQSAADLVARLRETGHPNYRSFMATGLTCELLTADQHLSLPVDERLETFEHMARAIGDIFDEAQQLHEAFRRIEQSPVNLRLQAVRCEDPGGPIGVIASNYSHLARDALAFAARFDATGAAVLDEINMGLFLMGATRLLRETGEALHQERGALPGLDVAHETAILSDQRRRCADMTRTTLERIMQSCAQLRSDSRRMRRFVVGLDVIRIACRMGNRPAACG